MPAVWIFARRVLVCFTVLSVGLIAAVGTSAGPAVSTPFPQFSLWPLGGQCQDTNDWVSEGDCTNSSCHKGSWIFGLTPEQCFRRCLWCERCSFISYDRRYLHCSWFVADACPHAVHEEAEKNQSTRTLQVRTSAGTPLFSSELDRIATRTRELYNAGVLALLGRNQTSPSNVRTTKLSQHDGPRTKSWMPHPYARHVVDGQAVHVYRSDGADFDQWPAGCETTWASMEGGGSRWYPAQTYVTLCGNRTSSSKTLEASSSVAVCVPPLYGYISLQRVVFFWEHYRKLGASLLYLYAVGDRKASVLEKMADVQQIVAPWALDRKAHQRSQHFFIADCIHRAAEAGFAWVVTCDLDETLELKGNLTLPDYLHGKTADAYTFGMRDTLGRSLYEDAIGYRGHRKFVLCTSSNLVSEIHDPSQTCKAKPCNIVHVPVAEGWFVHARNMSKRIPYWFHSLRWVK